MAAPAAIKGRIRDIYEGMYVWIDAALNDALYANYYVSMNYKFDVMKTVHDPVVTMRITPTVYVDEFYGRVWQGGGTPTKALQSRFMFSLHVFAKYNTGIGEDHNRDAWIAARIIIDHLSSLSRTTDLDPRGIRSIDDIQARESDPRIRGKGRIIIEGEIDVTREDSP